MERGATVIANHVPTYINTYKIVETDSSVELTETSIDSKQFKAVANEHYINAKVEDSATLHELENNEAVSHYDARERFDVSVSPHLAQSFGSAEDFLSL